MYATDCQLATYMGLIDRKRSPKSEISRAKNISIRMLGVCSTFKMDEVPGAHRQSRVLEILAGAPVAGGIESSLAAYVAKYYP